MTKPRKGTHDSTPASASPCNYRNLLWALLISVSFSVLFTVGYKTLDPVSLSEKALRGSGEKTEGKSHVVLEEEDNSPVFEGKSSERLI